MNDLSAQHRPEHEESLWVLTVPPGIWAVHFLATYLTAAIWCAKVADRSGVLTPVQVAVSCYTAAALVGIAWSAWRGYLRLRSTEGETPHDAPEHTDRHRFLGFATLLLAWLSAVATLFVAAVFLFVKTCD